MSGSSQSGTKITEELFPTWPEHPEDTCLWVDTYILRSTKRFDKCLDGLNASIDCVKVRLKPDLMRILWTEVESSKI